MANPINGLDAIYAKTLSMKEAAARKARPEAQPGAQTPGSAVVHPTREEADAALANLTNSMKSGGDLASAHNAFDMERIAKLLDL